MWFWPNVRLEHGQGYLVSRFAQVKRNAHAREICACLAVSMIHSLQEWSQEELPGDSLAVEYLAKERKTDLKSQELRLDQNGHFSWQGFEALNGRESHHALNWILQTDRIEDWSAIARICDALQICCGTNLQHGSRRRAPLQIQLPVMFFNSRVRVRDTGESRWRGAILRLLCVDVRAERLGEPSYDEDTKVVAHFDLSPGLTSELMTFLCHQGEDGDMVLRSTGSPEDLAHCLKRVQSEIWANKDERLDAWRQLYGLACVKTWFEDFWISRKHAIELGKIERQRADRRLAGY